MCRGSEAFFSGATRSSSSMNPLCFLSRGTTSFSNLSGNSFARLGFSCRVIRRANIDSSVFLSLGATRQSHLFFLRKAWDRDFQFLAKVFGLTRSRPPFIRQVDYFGVPRHSRKTAGRGPPAAQAPYSWNSPKKKVKFLPLLSILRYMFVQ
jgi:hypothetical protein